MRKTVDMNEIAEHIATAMAGRNREYTLPPETLNPGVVVADIQMHRTAAAFDSMDSYKSVKLDGLDHTVLSPQDSMRDILKVVQKKTAGLRQSLPKLAADARARGLIRIADDIEKLLEKVQVAQGLASIEHQKAQTEKVEEETRVIREQASHITGGDLTAKAEGGWMDAGAGAATAPKPATAPVFKDGRWVVVNADGTETPVSAPVTEKGPLETEFDAAPRPGILDKLDTGLESMFPEVHKNLHRIVPERAAAHSIKELK